MKNYHPSMCEEAERLYSEGKYEECVTLAIDAHNKAKYEAEEEWKELVKNPPSELAKLTVMWDTTTQRNLKYEEYLKSHHWEDDIPPAPLRIAAKALRKQAKKAIADNNKASALQYFLEIENISQLTESDKKIISKL